MFGKNIKSTRFSIIVPNRCKPLPPPSSQPAAPDCDASVDAIMAAEEARLLARYGGLKPKNKLLQKVRAALVPNQEIFGGSLGTDFPDIFPNFKLFGASRRAAILRSRRAQLPRPR